MANGIEIQVDTAALETSEKKLAVLSKSIANRKLKIQFSNAKGDAADNLLVAAQQLNSIGTALSCLISKTELAVLNTRVQFTAADQSVAQAFKASEE